MLAIDFHRRVVPAGLTPARRTCEALAGTSRHFESHQH